MSTKYRLWTSYDRRVIHIGVDAPEQIDILYTVHTSGHGQLGKVVDWRIL